MATASATPRKTTRKRASAPVEAQTTETEAEATEVERQAFTITLERVPAETRIGRKTQQGQLIKSVRTEKFVPVDGSGVTGALYFPLGTDTAKVRFEGNA